MYFWRRHWAQPGPPESFINDGEFNFSSPRVQTQTPAPARLLPVSGRVVVAGLPQVAPGGRGEGGWLQDVAIVFCLRPRVYTVYTGQAAHTAHTYHLSAGPSITDQR